MKVLAFAFWILAIAIQAGEASAQMITNRVNITEIDVAALVNKLKEQVKPGWTVGYRHTYQEIEITRGAPTRLRFIAPNLGPDQEQKVEVGTYGFTIMLFPLLSRTEYQKQRSENQKALRTMDVIYDALSKSQTVQGIRQPVFGESHFASKIPEEQAKIDEYYRLEGTLHRLPDGYLGEVSVLLPSFPPWDYGLTPEDHDVRHKCEQIYNKVAGALSKY
jgi:hypothetical protein